MMRPTSILLPLLLTTALMACSSTSEPAPTVQSPPAAKRDYDPVRGGVQITAVYYDQDANQATTGLYDEWLVLESQGDASTAGWHIDADDAKQFYSLPSTIHGTLSIYTRKGPGASDTTMALDLSKWIWNNTDPDTARLYDDRDSLVDTFAYKGK